jgi:hypothetical protein
MASVMEDIVKQQTGKNVIDQNLVKRVQFKSKSGKSYNMPVGDTTATGNFSSFFYQNIPASVGTSTTMGSSAEYKIPTVQGWLTGLKWRCSGSGGTLAYTTPMLLIDKVDVSQNGVLIQTVNAREMFARTRLSETHMTLQGNCKINGTARYLDGDSVHASINDTTEKYVDTEAIDSAVPLHLAICDAKTPVALLNGEITVKITLVASAWGHEDGATTLASASLEAEFLNCNNSSWELLKKQYAMRDTELVNKVCVITERNFGSVASGGERSVLLNEPMVCAFALTNLKNVTAVTTYATHNEFSHLSESYAFTTLTIQDENNINLIHNRKITAAENRLFAKRFFMEGFNEFDTAFDLTDCGLGSWCNNIPQTIMGVECGFRVFNGREKILITPGTTGLLYIYFGRLGVQSVVNGKLQLKF